MEGAAIRGVSTAGGILRPTDAALEHLRRHDRRLGAVIDAVGPLERAMDPDPFSGIVRHVVGQQVSGRAQAAVWARLLERLAPAGGMTPQAVLALGAEGVRSAGMSGVKAERITGIARQALSGGLDVPALAALPDEAVAERLVALPGVGPWTAEMLLIFCFGRADVLSFGDFGIRSGMMRLYGHRELPRARFERYRKRYAPFGTAASLYLWEVGNGRVAPEVWRPAAGRSAEQGAGTLPFRSLSKRPS